MKIKLILILALITLGTANTYANEVLFTTDKPLKVTYQIAHKNRGGNVIFNSRQTVKVAANYPLSIELGNYDLAGCIINAIDGIELPTNINQFDQPQQCSMTTNKEKPTGALSLSINKHTLKCSTFGGVYG